MVAPIESVVVSDEMVTLLGAGDVGGVAFPKDCAALVIDCGGTHRVTIHAESLQLDWGDLSPATPRIGLVVMRSALDRLFGWSPDELDGQVFFLNQPIADIANQLLDCPLEAGAATTYRLAKSIELLCEIVTALRGGSLVPNADGPSLRLADGSRLMAARKIIDEQWTEKLTLSGIARECGLNRTKLARAFREVYHCSISEALAERRLAEARRQLLSTDLPVGVIGYRTGYSNNASFTRAFGRRFGISPTDLRASRMAA